MKALIGLTLLMVCISCFNARAASYPMQRECFPTSGSLPGPSKGLMNTGIGAIFISATIGHYIFVDLICSFDGICTGFSNGGRQAIQPGSAKLLKDSNGQPVGFAYGAFSFACR